MNREKRLLLRAKRFVHENLALCCKELLEFSQTGILKAGCVREAAALVASLPLDPVQAMNIVESLVKEAALQFVVTRSK